MTGANGQMVTGTLMDYGIPRADTMPDIAVDFSPVPSKVEPARHKGRRRGRHGRPTRR